MLQEAKKNETLILLEKSFKAEGNVSLRIQERARRWHVLFRL